MSDYQIAIADAGYVGPANALLLVQHNKVRIWDIDPKKIELLRNRISPVEDEEIKDFLVNKKISFDATTDPKKALKGDAIRKDQR